MPEPSIRAETPSDRDAIWDVTAAALGREQEARIVDAIRASENFVPELSLVAEHDDRVVGYVLLSYVALDGRRVLEDNDIPAGAFMAIPLRAYDAALRGRVVFPPAFAV